MKIEFGELSQGVNRMLLIEDPQSLGLEIEEGTFQEPVNVALIATKGGDDISLSGVIFTSVELECSRCLEPFTQKIETDFVLFICLSDKKADVTSNNSDEDFVALPRATQRMDIGERIRQAVLLALPVKPLCDQSCLGLCPRCGSNRNKVQCHCQMESPDERWCRLKDLLHNDFSQEGG